ncbi:MAG: 23S rRNA (pseudouridine(1915)-N(3))-methyltransferase RlmH [Gammaproteobacteria bacterium]
MQINLLAIGTKMPLWVSQGYEVYARRMPRECQLKLIEIPPAQRTKNAVIDRVIKDEGARLLKAIPANHHVVALDVNGRGHSTEELSGQMDQWLVSGSDVSLVVGGPDGLAKACLQRADQIWSLSPLTLPHPLVRVVVAEQLYRAWTILKNHPYHRS